MRFGRSSVPGIEEKISSQQVENSVPPEWLERILALADHGMILIGGQALACWAACYETPAPVAIITKDVDFVGIRAPRRAELNTL